MKRTSFQRLASPSTSCLGFSMLVVVFILVVLASLSLALRQLTVTHHLETSQTLAVRQAQLAARSALDWARYRLVVQDALCSDLPASLVVDGITVNLECSEKTPVPREGSTLIHTFSITAMATVNSGQADEAKRGFKIEVFDAR